MNKLGIHDLGVICALGNDKESVARQLFMGESHGMTLEKGWIPDKAVYVGKADYSLPDVPENLKQYDCRNNRLLMKVVTEIRSSLDSFINKWGANRVAIVLGSSTSGILEGEEALIHANENGGLPDAFSYRQQEIGSSALFLKQVLNTQGPAYTISTACSSSAKVFASAQRLINAGICDAAIVGGADTLCRLTLNGFSALESVSDDICNPMGEGRNGITIGEGAALLLVSKEEDNINLAGSGESSDAYHISSPEPNGEGAEAAMRQALKSANIEASDINYLNMHGTATQKNDSMESLAIHRLFGNDLPCSSTKALTGHCLGAAGAIEAALLWLTLSKLNRDSQLPPHVFNGTRDAKLPEINLVSPGNEQSLPNTKPLYLMSNSFAFGGSNASIILSRNQSY